MTDMSMLPLAKPVRTKAKKTRKPKSPRAKLKDELDKLSKKIVYLRDSYTCQKCGKNNGTDYQASHVIPVSAGSKLRWDVKNMKVMCHHCHLNWWHKNPLEATEWFRWKFPDRYEYLQNNRGIKKFTLQELEDLKQSFKERLEEL